MQNPHSHSEGTCSIDTEVKDDPKARELLREAAENTSRWGADFPGFTAELICNDHGKTFSGTVTIKSPKEVEVALPDNDLQEWAQGQISMMAVHRSSRPFESSDGRHALTLGEDDNHPLGRLVCINGDGMNSRYRIKDGRITQINRSGERMKFTINVEESLTTVDGKTLTTRYTVFYFSPKDGKLVKAESYVDQPALIARPGGSGPGVYLPGKRQITYTTDQGETHTRVLEFKGHRLL